MNRVVFNPVSYRYVQLVGAASRINVAIPVLDGDPTIESNVDITQKCVQGLSGNVLIIPNCVMSANDAQNIVDNGHAWNPGGTGEVGPEYIYVPKTDYLPQGAQRIIARRSGTFSSGSPSVFWDFENGDTSGAGFIYNYLTGVVGYISSYSAGDSYKYSQYISGDVSGARNELTQSISSIYIPYFVTTSSTRIYYLTISSESGTDYGYTVAAINQTPLQNIRVTLPGQTVSSYSLLYLTLLGGETEPTIPGGLTPTDSSNSGGNTAGSRYPYQTNTQQDGKAYGGEGVGLYGEGTDPETDTTSGFDISGTGYTHIYALSASAVGTIISKMWTEDFLTILKQYFNGNFENAVLRLYHTRAPVTTTGSRTVYLGSYSVGVDGGIVKQQQRIHVGTYEIREMTGTYIDYQGELICYLPYIGFVSLSTDKYLSGTGHPNSIDVYVCFDFLAGTCLYQLYGKTATGNAELYDMFEGSIGADIPISSNQMTNYVSSLAGIIQSSLGTGSAAGAAGAATGAAGAIGALISGAVGIGSQALQALRKTLTSSGSITGNSGELSRNSVYFIVSQQIPVWAGKAAEASETADDSQLHYIGYQSHTIQRLSDMSGYVKCDDVYLQGDILQEEKNKITDLLRQGVYI